MKPVRRRLVTHALRNVIPHETQLACLQRLHLHPARACAAFSACMTTWRAVPPGCPAYRAHMRDVLFRGCTYVRLRVFVRCV